MRAAVLHGRGDLRVEEIPVPGSPGPGEVTIGVTWASVCGTDISEYRHGPVHTPLTAPHPVTGHHGPIVLGHEFTGVVSAVGEGVTALAPGERVVCGAGVSCGSCIACSRGRTNLCARYWTLGLHVNGGLAESVNAPAAVCARVPDGCSDRNAVLAQPLAVALHALRRGGFQQRQNVVVLGSGGVGLFCVFAATACGARAVHVVEVSEPRLALAERLGGVRLPKGYMPSPDLVLEASGVPDLLQRATRLVRPGGTVVAAGLPGEPVALEITRMAVNEIDLVTTFAHVYAAEFVAAIDLLAQHDLTWLTTEIPLADAALIFDSDVGAAKPVVRISDEDGR